MSLSININRNDVSHALEWAPSEWADSDTHMIVGDDDEELLSPTNIQAASKVLEQWLSDGQHEPNQRSQDIEIDYEVPYNPITPCDSSASSSEQDADLVSLMEVDEEIGNNLLGDEVFGGDCGVSGGEHLHLGCSLPAGIIEESPFSTMNSFSAINVIDDMSEEDRRFLAPLLEDSSTTTMDYDAGYVVTDEGSPFPSPSSPTPILNQERYQEIFKKLEASMKRSQETRKSLTMKTPKMKKYTRRDSVTGVLSSIENSSKQLQTFLQTVQQMQRTTV